jgi:hypothetical protein
MSIPNFVNFAVMLIIDCFNTQVYLPVVHMTIGGDSNS